MGKNGSDFGISKQMEGSPLVIGLGAFAISACANTLVPGSGLVLGMNVLGCISVLMQFVNGNEWDKIFTACNVGYKLNGTIKVPKLQEKTKTNNGYMLRFNVVEGLSLSKMQQAQEAIENYIGKKINITYNNKNFFIEVFDSKLSSVYQYEVPEKQQKHGIYFPLGYSIDGIEWLELSSDNPHMMIAGMAGSGKSVMLRSILTSIILLADKYESGVKLHLVDFKYGAEFNVFRKSKYVATFSRTEDECLNMLIDIDKKIDERYDLFYKNDVVNIDEYNKKCKKNKMDYELIFIDEFASLVENKNKEAIGILVTVAQKARACGIFLIISTQRPSADVVTGLIKQNFSSIIGMKCLDVYNSKIIFDTVGLEELNGKGHCLVRDNEGKEREIQGMLLSTEQAKKLLTYTYIEKVKSKVKGKIITKEELAEIKKSKPKSEKFLEVLKNET